MELIFVFAVIFNEVFLSHFFQVVEVVGAFRVDAFVDDKMFAVFFGDKGISTVRAAQLYGREAAIRWRKPGVTDLAHELSFEPLFL